ncbi:MAG: RpoN/RPB10 RNA polymerase subunit family protein [Promethearchaeota archaeon]
MSKPNIYLTKRRKNIIIIPIRCFSCGKLIAHTYEPYLEYIEKGESSEKAFKELGIERWCCKRMIVN